MTERTRTTRAVHKRRPDQNEDARGPWKSGAQAHEKPSRVYHLLGFDFTAGDLGLALVVAAYAALYFAGMAVAYNAGLARGLGA